MSEPANANPLPSMLSMMLASFLRHAMTSLGTVLIGAGALQPNQQEAFVGIASGLGVWLAGLAWSAAQKQAAKKAAAIPNPPQ